MAAFALMIFGILQGGVTALPRFFDAASVLITFGGAFMATMATQGSIPEFISNLKTIKLTLHKVEVNEEETIKSIINLSNVARKEGLLALEEAANGIDDAFLKKGLMLIVDGTDPELVRSIMETELSCVSARHKGSIGFWEAWWSRSCLGYERYTYRTCKHACRPFGY